MIKIVIVLIIFLLGYLLYKSRLGYIFILGYLLSFAISPIHKNLVEQLQYHEFLSKIYYSYIPYILLIFFLFKILAILFKKKDASTPNQDIEIFTATDISETHQNALNSNEINNLVKSKEFLIRNNLHSPEDSQTSDLVDSANLSKEATKDFSEIDNNLISLISLKKYFWDSSAEEKVYNIIKDFFNENYIITPHVSFREILRWNWKINSQYENFRISSMHFDFVIHDKEQLINKPALIIEVWGKSHYDPEKPWVMRTDKFKQAILKKCGLAFIIIDLSQTIPEQEIREKVIESIKKGVPSREYYTVYCPKCQAVMKIKPNRTCGVFFYGCTEHKDDGTGCDGNRSITDNPKQKKDVAPLYAGIPIKL